MRVSERTERLKQRRKMSCSVMQLQPNSKCEINECTNESLVAEEVNRLNEGAELGRMKRCFSSGSADSLNLLTVGGLIT